MSHSIHFSTQDLDQILDVDTSCDSRKEFVKSFASKVTGKYIGFPLQCTKMKQTYSYSWSNSLLHWNIKHHDPLDISADVQSAIQDKDVSKVAPKTLKYGKAFSNFQAFQKQLVSDILPDLLTRGKLLSVSLFLFLIYVLSSIARCQNNTICQGFQSW